MLSAVFASSGSIGTPYLGGTIPNINAPANGNQVTAEWVGPPSGVTYVWMQTGNLNKSGAVAITAETSQNITLANAKIWDDNGGALNVYIFCRCTWGSIVMDTNLTGTYTTGTLTNPEA